MELAADVRPRRRAFRLQGAMAPLLECLAVLAAIAAWLPAFDGVAAFGEGRDGRYADAGFRVDGLPEPVLPAMCRSAASFADPPLRDRLCKSAPAARPPASWQALSETLAQAASRAARAFNAPVIDARLRLEALRLQQREGLGDLRDVAGAMAANTARHSSSGAIVPRSAKARLRGRTSAAISITARPGRLSRCHRH